ncbi:MAG: hypothetical protein WKF53_08985 [Rubrobacter sp.]|jgi:hypothetical protein
MSAKNLGAAGGEKIPRHLEMVKEREPKEDGRYIIFYTFEGETEEEVED